jgi:divalent metal cation (Fe/Co/Zn/Cd) transporter
LFLAIAFEGAALFFALRSFKKHNTGKYGLVQSVMKSKDSASVAIIMEDTAAIIGLLVALIGVTLTHQLEMPIIDGITSICIGLLLGIVAAFLAKQSKGLLLGESMSPEQILRIKSIINGHIEVTDFSHPKTMHFGPESVLLAVDVEFRNNLLTDKIEDVVLQIETQIKAEFSMIDKCFIETVGIDRGRKE